MADGKVVISTELDNSRIPSGIKEIKGSIGGLTGVVNKLGKAIGIAFSVGAIVQFGKESVNAANELSNALTGLQSILDGQGRSFSAAQKFIEEYTKDGLIPATNAITAYKNLAMRGYDDSQIQQVMVALKDASAFGRQASYSMGDAVQSATEGLKNENSILVDNAGVTKNVAKMWEEYAASIGTTANNLTQQQKIQAEVNGILEESKYQTGDAAKVAGTLSGQLTQLSYNFNNLKIAVGNAVNPILQKLIPVINSAVQALTKFANAIASVVGALFGKATVQTNAIAEANGYVASSAIAGADAEKELANATKTAGKAAQKSLASFDELNVLQSNSGGGGSSGVISDGGSGGLSAPIVASAQVEDTISPKLQAVADKIKKLVEPLKNIDFSPAVAAFERLKKAIEPITSKLFEGLEWAWYNILVPLAKWTVEDSLPAFLYLLSESLDVLSSVIDVLQPLGIWLWTEFLQPLAEWTGGVIVDTINGLADALSKLSVWIRENQEWISNVSTVLGSIAAAFAGFSAISGIIEYVEAVAALAPEVGVLAAMFPKLSAAIATVGTWITGTLIPAISGALSGIAGALGISVGWVAAIVVAVGAAIAALVIYWDEIKAFFTDTLPKLWDQFIGWLGEAWESVKGVWNAVSGWFDENVIQPVASFFSGLWNTICGLASDAWESIKEFFSPAIDWFSELFGSIWKTISDVFYNIGVIASGCWEIIKAVWTIVSTWFNTNIIQPVGKFFSDLWISIKTWAINAWNGIKSVFSTIGSWINANVIQPVGKFFANLWKGFSDAASKAWNAVKTVFGNVASFFKDTFQKAWQGIIKVFSVAGEIFTDIKDAILSGFKVVVNGIIRGLNSAIAIPFNGINSALRSIKNINILGLTPFSGLREISVPQIPYLAQGAVLPANKPFLAMVGDQKHGTNVEAPLETIQEAVALVMDDYIASNTAGQEAMVMVLRDILQAVLGIQIGDSVIGEAVARYQQKMAVVKGY